MADGTQLNVGAGGSDIFDEAISGFHYPVGKIVLGDHGIVDGDVSKNNPLPVGEPLIPPLIQRRFDIQLANNVIYIGFAAQGVLTSASTWTIKRITLSGGLPTAIQWSTPGNVIWDNRASVSFS